MVNEKETKAYHDKILKDVAFNKDAVNYHIRQAQRMKELYLLTKNRKGIYKLLNSWALKCNKRHYKKGMELSIKTLDVCFKECDYLDDYMKRFKEES